MSTQVGRISGALLKDNLLRNGVDIAFETELLYLDVNNLKIGIKSSSPTRDLFINNSALTINTIVDTRITATDVVIKNNSEISTLIGDLNFVADQISAARIETSEIKIDDNKIETFDSDIEIRPQGVGKVFIDNNVDITGSLHSTGNITLDGTITFGSDAADVISFASDINSSLIPDINDFYTIGNFGNIKRWNNLYAGLLNGVVLTAEGALVLGTGTSIEYRQGNIWYVSSNGHYTNVGNHPNGPFDTIELALKNAKDGDTVYVYPGTYYELFPLIVPEGVTIKGCDIRNVKIKPDTASTHEDVFLLNDRTTISDLTIENFYFDSLNNKGYAFRFAPNINITYRSPYIQNVSVITQGSVTSLSDPRGFDQGDAGKGAYIDGAVANILTNYPTMLFESVTFITPGVDAITMINGVRVELVNSFFYLSNRALYALEGTGRLLQDNSTLEYGAEIRCFNCSISYGNYGAVADGTHTLINLINHNFAFVGAGKNTENDFTLIIQANEIVKLNNGVVHHLSLDQSGVYRVGDIFFVDQINNTSSLSTSSILGSSIEGFKLFYNGFTVFVDFNKIEVGAFRISGNLIESLEGPINVTSASNEINLNLNVDIYNNLIINNNFKIDGVLYLGNQPTDSIVIYPKLDQDINPKADNSFDLGSVNDQWLDMWFRTAHISDLEINTNNIRSSTSNENLEFRANGTGSILVEGLRVNENVISTDSNNIEINSATTVDIFSNTTFNSNLYVTQDFNVDSDITFGLDSSNIVTFITTVNSVIHPQIDNLYSLGDSNHSWNLYTGKIELDEIDINDNYIRTTASNLNLELKASGSGAVRIEQTDFNENVILTNGITNLEIRPATTLDIYGNTTANSNLYVTQNVILDSDTTFGLTSSQVLEFNADINTNIIPSVNALDNLGDPNLAWNLYTGKILLDDIEISDNYIRTITTNLNLEFKASGTGVVRVEQTDFDENVIRTNGINNLIISPASTLDIYGNTTANSNLYVTQNVILDSSTTFGSTPFETIYFNTRINSDIIPTFNAVNDLGDSTLAWNLYTGKILLDDIEISDNYIRTITTNLNLEFKASGTGAVRIEQTDFDENIIRTNGVTNLELRPATTLDIYGNTTANSNLYVTQNVILDSDIILGSTPFETVYFNTRINSDIVPTFNAINDLGESALAWNLYTGKILLDDIEINDNYIKTITTNLNLEFKASGTGAVRVEQTDFNENVIRTNGSTNLIIDPASTLDIFSDTNVNANLLMTGNFTFNGDITIGNSDTDNIVFNADIDSNLIPNIDISYDLGSFGKRWRDLYVGNAYIGDIEINTNYIRTTNGNLDLVLQGNAAGGVRTEDIRFVDNKIQGWINNQNIQMSLTGSSILDINTNTALRLARGTSSNRLIPNMVFGEMRFNTSDNLFGGFTTARTTFGGVYSADRLTFARVEPLSNIITFSSQSITAAYVDTSKLWLNGLLVDSIGIQNNVVSTNNINLNLNPDGTEVLNVEVFRFDNDVIMNNVTDQSLTIAHTSRGYLEIKGSLGFQIPAGTDAERAVSPDEGTTRWSTENEYLEMYINGQWGLATGGGTGYASASDIEEINLFYTLILG